MNFSDLQSNDIVITKDGKKYMIHKLKKNTIFVNKDISLEVKNLFKGNTFKSVVENFNIIKVRRPIYSYTLSEPNWDLAPVIWEERSKQI